MMYLSVSLKLRSKSLRRSQDYDRCCWLKKRHQMGLVICLVICLGFIYIVFFCFAAVVLNIWFMMLTCINKHWLAFPAAHGSRTWQELPQLPAAEGRSRWPWRILCSRNSLVNQALQMTVTAPGTRWRTWSLRQMSQHRRHLGGFVVPRLGWVCVPWSWWQSCCASPWCSAMTWREAASSRMSKLHRFVTGKNWKVFLAMV